MNDNEPNLYAAEDKRWANVDNPNDEYAAYDRARPSGRRSINVIDHNGEPMVLRNVASYYAANDDAWSQAMARRLRTAANDNAPVKKRAA